MKQLVYTLPLFISVAGYATEFEALKRNLKQLDQTEQSPAKRFKSMPATPPLTATTASAAEIPSLVGSTSSTTQKIDFVLLATMAHSYTLLNERVDRLEEQNKTIKTETLAIILAHEEMAKSLMQQVTQIQEHLKNFEAHFNTQLATCTTKMATTLAEHTQTLKEHAKMLGLESDTESIGSIAPAPASLEDLATPASDDPEIVKNGNPSLDFDTGSLFDDL